MTTAVPAFPVPGPIDLQRLRDQAAAIVAPRPLELPIEQDDVDNVTTVGEYLAELLTTLLDEEEGFDSKRPFGNSGWLGAIEDALENAGLDSNAELYAAITEALTAKSAIVIPSKPKGQVIALDEELRVYQYPNSGKVALKNPVELIVRDNGTHRVKTADGFLHIVSAGWLGIHIKSESQEWVA